MGQKLPKPNSYILNNNRKPIASNIFFRQAKKENNNHFPKPNSYLEEKISNNTGKEQYYLKNTKKSPSFFIGFYSKITMKLFRYSQKKNNGGFFSNLIMKLFGSSKQTITQGNDTQGNNNICKPNEYIKTPIKEVIYNMTYNHSKNTNNMWKTQKNSTSGQYEYSSTNASENNNDTSPIPDEISYNSNP